MKKSHLGKIETVFYNRNFVTSDFVITKLAKIIPENLVVGRGVVRNTPHN